ncbi:MAG: sigma-70 family RNA polymerase sigma factor [Clostridiales bacterium]|nr:sigma-70 family RNA polymerase sigma factor [Clostridiales bacterium]
MNATELDRMELLRLAKSGDRAAEALFFEQNQRLVRMLVKRFLGRGTDYEDLYQIGCLAFVKAVKNFDLEAGVQFSTYAVPVILGELRRHFRDTGALRISRSIKDQARLLSELRERLTAFSGREPTLLELAAEADMEPSAVALALDSLAPVLSLSHSSEEGSSELIDLLGEDPTERMIDRVAVDNLLGRLPEKERKLLLLRYFRSRTQQETAEEMGISQVQVSRLERRLLEQLRQAFDEGEEALPFPPLAKTEGHL